MGVVDGGMQVTIGQTIDIDDSNQKEKFSCLYSYRIQNIWTISIDPSNDISVTAGSTLNTTLSTADEISEILLKVE